MDKKFIFTMKWNRSAMAEPENEVRLKYILQYAYASGWENAELQIVIDDYARPIHIERLVNHFLKDATNKKSFLYTLFGLYYLRDRDSWIQFCSSFITNYLILSEQPQKKDLAFDVFPRDCCAFCFRIYADQDSIPDEKYKDLFFLGADDLLAMPENWIFENVLIPFYQHLNKYDKLDAPEVNDLSTYQIGLA